MHEKLKKYWFLLGITILFVTVLLDSTLTLSGIGIEIKKINGPQIAIVLVFLFSGLLIEPDDVLKGLHDVKGTVISFLLIFIIAPLIAYIFSLSNMPTGIITGLFLVASMPSTLSSGVVMTGSAGGNMAHALMITILSNITATFTIPFTLAILIGINDNLMEIEINKTAIITKIALLVVLPLIIGLVVKSFINIKKNIRNKFQIFNQIFVLIIVFMALSEARSTIVANFEDSFLVFFVVFSFHGFMLLSAFTLIKVFNIKKGKRESIIFMGGQKTLPLSLVLLVSLFPQFGIALVVCVSHHIIHLMMDSYLIGFMNKKRIS
ncbi:MAG: bile acid:sodium symporter [Desulfobacterales bacterium]|nr:bile acid:sodium symporter [Desulfobacterales bacterium]